MSLYWYKLLKKTTGKDQTNLPWIRLSSYLCRYSACQEVERITIYFLSAGWTQWHLFKTDSFEREGKKVTLKWRSLTHMSKWSRSTSVVVTHIGSLVHTLDLMWWKWHLSSIVFLLKTHENSLIMRKAWDKSPWGTVFKVSDNCSLNRQGHLKQGKSEKLPLPRKA